MSVLVIDNNSHRCESLCLVLEFMEYSFQQVKDVSQARELDNHQFDMMICFATDDIIVQLHELNQSFPQSKVAVLTDQTEQHEALNNRCTKYPNFLGVLDYPIKKQQLKNLISRLEPQSQAKSASETILDEMFVGETIVIRQVKKLITQVAKSNASVLILGESGTGKEVVANCLHKLSKRNKMPYVPVNCGAIPRDLLESELFGHEKGAFTGALTTRKGRFELAQGGSLFLDEIGDMPLPMQVKILRVLQERIFERVGGNKSMQADVRVIAATHRDLENEVKEGRFREDLFYRLNVFPIEIPSLRERVEDIPLLFHFLNKHMQSEEDNSVQLTPEAMASLMQHAWPGNVRELSNLVERLGIMFPNEMVDLEDLPEKYQHDISHLDELPQIDIEHPARHREEPSYSTESEAIESEEEYQTIGSDHEIDDESITTDSASMNQFDRLPEEDFDLKDHLANLEYSIIQQALKESDGVVAHAAKRLNMRRTTLVEKMKKYEALFGA